MSVCLYVRVYPWVYVRRISLCPYLWVYVWVYVRRISLCPYVWVYVRRMSLSPGLCLAYVAISGSISPSPTAVRHKPHSVAYSWGGITAYHRGLRPDGLLNRSVFLF